MNEDKELTELPYYTGTEKYTNFMDVKITDGIVYIMKNGYNWLITDILPVLRIKLKSEPFCSIKLKLKDTTGEVIITDGNSTVLHKEYYNNTDAKKELTLFYTDNVLMLSGEY